MVCQSDFYTILDHIWGLSDGLLKMGQKETLFKSTLHCTVFDVTNAASSSLKASLVYLDSACWDRLETNILYEVESKFHTS